MSQGVMNLFSFFVLSTLFIAFSQCQDLNTEILQKNGSETIELNPVEVADFEKGEREARGVPAHQHKAALNKSDTDEESVTKDVVKAVGHKHQGTQNDKADEDLKKKNKYAPVAATSRKPNTEATLQLGESLVEKSSAKQAKRPNQREGEEAPAPPAAEEAAPAPEGAAPAPEGDKDAPGSDAGPTPKPKPKKNSSTLFKSSIYLVFSLIMLPLVGKF